MKNVFLLPTDKPSRLQLNVNTGKLILFNNIQSNNESAHLTTQNIYITNSEEIKDCWVLNTHTNEVYFLEGYYGIQPIAKKIILTTDQSLDGVQAIDDEFLEWFVKNPSCEKVEIDSWSDDLDGIWLKKYKIIIPKQKDNQHSDFEEYMSLVEKYTSPKEESYPDIYASKEAIIESHILFAKWQQEQHDFLPGFIKQFDPKEGEIKGWTAIEFLRWLDLNRCKIVK